MKKRLAVVAMVSMIMAAALPAWASSPKPAMSADQAMTLLKEGNARFVAGKPKHPMQDKKRRAATAEKGQKPFVTILACSDSRVPAEILFDRGIGDLFVVRVAGNVADVDEIGTMEYGTDHLGTPLLVVLGHSKCGAVTAVVQGAEVHGNIPALVSKIVPAANKAKEQNPGASGEALVNAAITANVWQAVEDLLKKSDITRERVKKGDLKIVGALYDITSGKVEWLGGHPEQDKLLAGPAVAPTPAPTAAPAPEKK